MGIPKLTKFIHENFDRWHWLDDGRLSHLVVDGCGLSNFLYCKYYKWCLGGEYCAYGQRVEKSFEMLRSRFEIENLTVVMDGGSFTSRKNEGMVYYTTEAAKKMGSKSFVYAVFMDILRQLDWARICTCCRRGCR